MSTYKEVRTAYKSSNTPITAQWSMNPAGIKSYNEGQGWCCGTDVLAVDNGVLELHRCNKGRGGDPCLTFVPADGGPMVLLINFDEWMIGGFSAGTILKAIEDNGIDYVMARVERHMLGYAAGSQPPMGVP